MKKKKFKNLFVSVLFFGAFGTLAAQTENVQFLNTGIMNVGEGAVLRIEGDMRMVGAEVAVRHDGTLNLTGSFFHDAQGNVFYITDPTAWNVGTATAPRGVTTSTGVIRFVDNNAGGRSISSIANLATFNRVSNYVAFPRLEIATNDTIVVPAAMGLDASTIVRTTGTGMLRLESARIGDVIYTASLRVTGDDGDFTVSPDAVIVEQWVREFRDPSATGATTTAPATLLMPFAAPFTELHSGYFAGNWVRRPVFTLPGRNSFLFPYANESTNGVVINSNQYIVYPHTIFEPAAAHLVRLQSTGFTNTGDSELILIEGWEPQTTDKFVFDGSIGGTVGSLFAGAPVLDRTSIPVIPPGMPPAIAAQVTQNWLAGNSFTSGLNANAIAEYLLTFGSELTSNLFIYHFGATAYETHNTADTNIPDIEAMGIFMMQVAGDGNNTNVVIDHRFQVHTSGIAAAGIPIAPTNPLLPTRSARVAANSNRLVFVLTPEDNPFVFSRTEIMMSEDAGNQNITSLVNPGNHLFHLHSTDQSGVRLQRNVVSFSATKALLAVTPAVDEMQVILTVQNAGDFPTEIVELFDRQTNTLHDLRADNAYNFVMLPNDDANRFEVRFVRQEITTGLDNNTTADWFVFSNNNYLTITGLDVSLLNEQMYIRNAAGMLYVQQTINQTPELRINIASLPTGVYMVSIQGRTVKFIK